MVFNRGSRRYVNLDYFLSLAISILTSFSLFVAIIIACLASFRALFTQQNRSRRVQTVKDISGPITVQGKKAKLSVALQLSDTASIATDSVGNPFPHINDDTTSDVSDTPGSQDVPIQRQVIVSSHADGPLEIV